MPTASHRTPVTLVTGLHRTTDARIAYTLLAPGTTVVSHDLRDVAAGRVTRIEHRMLRDGTDTLSIDDVTLEHGCVSCTMRLDLLPLLRTLHRDPEVERIVVLLDPAIEPERLAVEIAHTIVECPGAVDAPAGTEVTIAATVCGIDAPSWLADATGDATLYEAGVVSVEDERTLAQVAVAQARFADALIVDAADGVAEPYDLARIHAVLLRLAPAAGMRTMNSRQTLTGDIVRAAIESADPTAPHGRPTAPFDPLLRGLPDLDVDCGVGLMSFEADRPFHPTRLHDALDILLDGVVTARGRLWMASDPDDVMWLESAGGALDLRVVGTWLACVDTDPWDDLAGIDPELRALAALRWDPTYGDRHSALTVLHHHADPSAIRHALEAALVTDDELAGGPDRIAALESPFGHAHRDPCEDTDPRDGTQNRASTAEGEQ